MSCADQGRKEVEELVSQEAPGRQSQHIQFKMLACCLELLNTERSSPARPMANRRPEEGGVHAEEKRHLRQRGLELQWRTQAAWDTCMRSDRTEVATPSCHLLALCLWENLLTSLSFNLFTYNMKICQK